MISLSRAPLACAAALALAAPCAAQTPPVAVSTRTLYEHRLSEPGWVRPVEPGFFGTVHVRVTLSDDGELTAVRAVSGPARLRSAAVAEVERWEFRPVVLRGAPRAVTGIVLVRFADVEGQRMAWAVLPNGRQWVPNGSVAGELPRAVAGGVPVDSGVPMSVPEEDTPPPPPPAVRPPPAPPNVVRVSGGVLAGKATHKPQPEYPQLARVAEIEGAVVVEVIVDEDGRVISAHAVSGHPLLRDAAIRAARGWTFTPTQLSGRPVKIIGTITFNFRKN